MANTTSKDIQKKREFPHIMVLFLILITLASIATYIIPAGQYEYFEGTTSIDPNSFHYIDSTPVNPITAIYGLQPSLTSSGTLMSLLFILGGATQILIASGAINSLVDTGIKRFSDKSIIIVIPMIYALMSILGALCGNDSMIAYVAIGVIIAKTLKLDAMCAAGMFYLPYITAQAAGPTTAIALTAQQLAGVKPLSGIQYQLLLEVIFYVMGCAYVTRYALKVNRDPSKSLMGEANQFDHSEAVDITASGFGNFELKALLSVITVIAGYGIYIYGSMNYGWSWNQLCFSCFVASCIIGVLNKMNINHFCREFSIGVSKMALPVFFMSCAKIIGTTLTNGNVIHTIAYSVSNLLSGFSSGVGAVGLFLFNVLFNFLVPSGTTQAAIVLPITLPIGEVIGVSNEMIALGLQLGDGVSNCLTPLSGVLIGAITIANIDYPTWIKFAIKIALANIVVIAIALFTIQTLGLL